MAPTSFTAYWIRLGSTYTCRQACCNSASCVVLSYEALAEGLSADVLIGRVMERVAVPDKPLQHTPGA